MPKLKKKETELLKEYVTNPEVMARLFNSPYTATQKDKQFLRLFKTKPEEVKEAIKQIFKEVRKDFTNI